MVSKDPSNICWGFGVCCFRKVRIVAPHVMQIYLARRLDLNSGPFTKKGMPLSRRVDKKMEMENA